MKTCIKCGKSFEGFPEMTEEVCEPCQELDFEIEFLMATSISPELDLFDLRYGPLDF
jgi:hypothetical protein